MTDHDHDDGYDEDDRSDQVRSALVKAVAVIAGIAVLIALGTVLVVRALGLDQGESAGPVGSGSSEPRKPLPSTALPVPGEESESASPADEPSKKPRGKGRIQLSISPVSARPNERVNLTGTYRGADNVALQVQRYEEGRWSDFGVDATVRVGTYETWIMTGRPGEHRFRVWDPAARRGSNVVLVTIG